MAIKMNQSMKQSQNLTMTPQLQQAIKLLTLTHLEMTNVIAEEMVENPMLEEFSSEDGPSEEDYKLERLENQNKEASAENFQEETVVGKDDLIGKAMLILMSPQVLRLLLRWQLPILMKLQIMKIWFLRDKLLPITSNGNFEWKNSPMRSLS